MNILVLNYEYPPLGGGAAPVCRDLAAGMAEKGHKVTVVTMGYPGLPACERQGNVRIVRLRCLRKRAHACMPWEALSYIAAAKRFLEEHLKKQRYDVCHAHFILPTGPVARWLKQKYAIPYVLTAHGSDVEGHNSKLYMRLLHRLLRPVWRRIVRDSYAVVAPSVYLMKLLNREMRSGHYIRIPNGIDIRKYETAGEKKKRRILLMGRMQKAKNFQVVLNAVGKIPEELWNGYKVDILGDGPYRKELEKLSEKPEIRERVVFRG